MNITNEQERIGQMQTLNYQNIKKGLESQAGLTHDCIISQYYDDITRTGSISAIKDT